MADLGSIRFTTEYVGAQIVALTGYWGKRNLAFTRFDDLLAQVDANKVMGLESIVTNKAKTLFALSQFMTAASTPSRTVAIGDQGPNAERRSGKAERALISWWKAVDEQQLLLGREAWQYEMAWWMCLYGWYATMYLTAVQDDGSPEFISQAYDPTECYPDYGGPGLARFARRYSVNAAEALRKAEKYSGSAARLLATTPAIQPVTLVDWWQWEGGVVVNGLLCEGFGAGGWGAIKPLQVVTGLKRIPVLCGPVGGTPSRDAKKTWMDSPGSVLAENERVYEDFNKWLSHFSQLVKEHTRAPIILKKMHLEDEDVAPSDIRSERAIIETDDPEAAATRLDVGESPIDVIRLLQYVAIDEQRGGMPDAAYGTLLTTLSGFGISQLLQAGERRVGAQVRKLAAIDALISAQWLHDFKNNEFAPVSISGFVGGNPRASFIENFAAGDVPETFQVSTSIPLRLSNDMMSRIAIARQAVGGQAALLDTFTALDEIIQIQDPALVKDRIDRDAARELTKVLNVSMELRVLAEDTRQSGKPGADQAAKLIEQYADMLVQQQMAQFQAKGAQPTGQPSPEVQSPEARGVSPDQVRAMLQMGPPPNQTAAEQSPMGQA